MGGSASHGKISKMFFWHTLYKKVPRSEKNSEIYRFYSRESERSNLRGPPYIDAESFLK